MQKTQEKIGEVLDAALEKAGGGLRITFRRTTTGSIEVTANDRNFGEIDYKPGMEDCEKALSTIIDTLESYAFDE